MVMLNVYEYLVVQRVTDKMAANGERDSIIITPKTIMAGSEKEVERLAIREVPSTIDIALVEVFVRPFVGK